MARISYDEQTATAFKAVRGVPRDGLSEWRAANRETQKTAEGIHVGSPESALHDAYPRLHCRTQGTDFRGCWTGHLSGPKSDKATDYRIGIGTGNVKSITVTAIAATVFLD
jgi:hypothetical protein